MKGVLDLQRRGQQIGRIRIGQQVKASNGKMRPAKLDTFRLTTQSRRTADEIAALYGGEVREWNAEWEIITGKSEIGVTVPPRDQVVSQAYELWSRGGCQRRCDSQHEQISDGPCLCPHAANTADEDEVARKAIERSNLASKNPPEACKLVTRISVMLPDLPGLGVFRLDTGSYYAGVEIGDAAQLMEMARDKGVFLPAVLRIEQRTRVANGQTKKYPVPVLEVLATFRQIASGQLEAGGIAAQLPPAPGEQPKAIAAPAQPSDMPRPGPAGEVPELTRDLNARGSHVNAEPAHPLREGADRAGPGHTEPLDEEARYQIAQGIADRLAVAQASDEFKALGKEMDDAGCGEVMVCVDREGYEQEQLRDFGLRLWDEKAKEVR